MIGVDNHMSKTKALKVLKYALLFILLFLFFLRICPIVPYEGDDWYFLGAMRQPNPYLNVFNPSKVLPEVLEPLCGYAGAYLIYPFTHDYVGSLSIASTGCVCLFIVAMLYLFNRVLRMRHGFSVKKAFLYELLFLVFFFVFFKQQNQTSYYGFWSKSLNCYFNYLIPALINACAVLFMMAYVDFQSAFNKMNYYRKGAFLLLVYFSAFSSIQLNIILSSYAFVCFLRAGKKAIKECKGVRDRVWGLWKSSWIYVLILITWFVSVLFDLSGSRGKMVSNPGWFSLGNAIDTAKALLGTYKKIYFPLLIILILGLVLLLVYGIVKKKLNDILFSFVDAAILLILNFAYLTLIYMQAGKGYAERPDATWGILFYIILLIISVIIMCNTYIRASGICVPVMLAIFTLVAFNLNQPFAQSIYDAGAAKEVDNYIINQIVEADRSGASSVEVLVPKFEDQETNWPIPYNMATWLQNTLYAHRITRNRMYITFVPDENVSKEFYNKDYSNMFFFDFERSMYLQ